MTSVSSSTPDLAPLLRRVFESMPQAAALFAVQAAHPLLTNRAWDRLSSNLGRTVELDAIFPGEGTPALLKSVASGGQAMSHRAAAAAVPLGGTATWWDLDFVPQHDAAGAVCAVLLTATEVTNEVLAQRDAQAAREAEAASVAKLQLASEAAGVGSWEWDVAADRQAWSPQQFRVHGMDPAHDAPPDFTQWLAMVHPEDHDKLVAAARSGFRTPEGHYQVTFRLRRADDGAERWLLSQARVTEADPDGRPRRILGINIDITECVLADRRRQEAVDATARAERARLAAILERLPVGVAVAEAPEGRIVVANATNREIFGGHVGETLAESAAAAPRLDTDGLPVPPTELPLGRALWRGETVRDAPLRRARLDDGSLRDILVSAAPIHDDAGRISAAIATFQDVTESRHTEEALAASEAQLQEALRTGHVYAFSWDPASDAVRRSASSAPILGVPEGRRATEDTGRDYFAAIHPEDRDRFVATATGVTPERPRYQARYRYTRADGRVAWLAESGAGVFAPDGRLLRLSGLTRDVTAEAEAEERLRESEHFLRGVLDSLPEHVAVLDARGVVIAVNEPWARFARENGAGPGAATVGSDYLAACRAGAIAGDPCAAEALAGLEAVIAGTQRRCSIEYPCHTPDRERWFLMHAERPENGVAGAIVTHLDITDRRRADEALRQSEARLRRVQRIGRVGGFEIDLRDGVMAGINRRSGEYMAVQGISAHAATERHQDWVRRLHPEDRASAERRFLDAVADKGADEYAQDYRIVTPAGETRWIAARAEIERDPATGRVLYMRGAHVDVTEQKQAEAALARFRLVTQGLRDIVLFLGEDGRILDANDAAATAYGHDRDALLRLTIADLRAPETLAALGPQLAQARDGGVLFETLHRRADGSTFPVEVSATGAVIGGAHVVVSVVRDITERREAERATLLMRSFVDRANDMFSVHDIGTARVVYSNPTHAAALGYTQAELLNLAVPDVDPGWSLERFRALVDRLRAGEAVPPFETALRRRDGTFLPVEISASLIAHDGQPYVGAVMRDITQRKAAEAALAESEAMLRLAQDAARIGCYDRDLVTGALRWSAQAFALFGLAPPADGLDMVPRGSETWFDAILPEDRDRVRREIAAALARRAPGGTLQFRIRRGDDGAVRHIESRSAYTYDPATGQPLRAIGAAIDVTERVDAEERLARLAAIVATTSDAIISFGAADGHITSWNAGAEALFGYTAAEALGGPVDLLVPPELPESDPTGVFRRALAGERVHQHETVRIAKDGTRIPVVVTAARMVAADGAVLGVSGIFRDLRTRKAADAALRESEAFARHISDVAPSILYIYDLAENRNVWGNREMIASLGYGADEIAAMSGQLIRTLMHPEDLARHAGHIARVLALGDGETAEFEYRFRRRDGAWVWLYSRDMVFRRDPAGRPVQIIGSALDITGRKTAEAALAESEARLRRATEAGRLATFDVEDADAGGRARVSDNFPALYGLPPGARCDFATILATIHPEDRAAFVADHARLAAEGGRFASQFRVVLPDGGIRWIEASGEAEPGTGGVPARLFGVNLDVTERKSNEMLIAASEARYRSFVEASSSVIWTMTPDGQVGEPIPSWQAYTGQGFEQARGLGFLDAIHAEDRAAVIAAWQRATAREDVYEVEYRLRRHDDIWRNVVARGAPVRDGAGRILEWIGTCTDVTERRAAERAVAASEARLRDALQTLDAVYSSAPVGLCLVDTDLRFVRINERLAEINGVPASQHLGRTVRDVVPGISDQAEALLRRILETGEPQMGVEIEGETPAQPGVRRAWSENWLPFRDSDGRVVGINITAEEITERKRTETALRESEARLRRALAELDAVYGTVPVGMALVDRAFRFVSVNAALARFNGLPVQAHLGRTVAEVVPEMWPALKPYYRAVLDHGEQVIDLPILGRTPGTEGEDRHWLVSCLPVRDDAGTVWAVSVAARDVTAQRRAETALRGSEERFRALAQSFPGIVFETGADGLNTYTNRHFQEFTGLAAEALLGDGWIATLHPDDRARAAASWDAAVRSGGPYEAEYRFRCHDGTWRWYLCRGAPERAADGTILRWHGAAVDISDIVAARDATAHQAEELERRVAERTRALSDTARELVTEMARREDAQAALLQSQKLEALGQLTGSVAHDFGNVLAAVAGAFRLIEDRTDDAMINELIGHGQRAVDRAVRLIRQLLSFARKEEMRPARTDLGEALRETEDMVCHTAGPGVQCMFEVAPDVWPVLVDPVRLETVLLNLAANARDAMAEGGTLTLAARNALPAELPPGLPPGRPHVLITVSDSGAGMDEETLRRATEPFFTTKSRGQGTGLGLASAHGFAEQSGGALRLRSAPGQGTTVELFLPRADLLAGVSAAEEQDAGQGSAERVGHGNATLLLVDDDHAVRPVMAGLLRRLGYTVLEAHNAEVAEALAHTEHAGIDMLVTDVVMGGAPGSVLAARMRAERPDLPVLYVTGHPGSADLAGDPVLYKPFTDGALSRAVLEGLGRRPAETARVASDRLGERLRHPALREAHRRWRALRDAAGGLPAPAAFLLDGVPDELADRGYLIEVLGAAGAGGYRFLRVGRALEDRLGRRLAGEVLDPAAVQDGIADIPGSAMAAAYGRCVRTASPTYEYARFGAPAEDGGVLFERLLMPFSEGGTAVTHLVGLVLITETKSV